MISDGYVLPDPAEAAVLVEVGLVRTDELPGLAARWLAADVADTGACRMLAAHDRSDSWGLRDLLSDVLDEGEVDTATGVAKERAIIGEWVARRSLEDLDVRAAVRLLAGVGEARPELALGAFVDVDDEWRGGYFRSSAQLEQDAQAELRTFLEAAPPDAEAV